MASTLRLPLAPVISSGPAQGFVHGLEVRAWHLPPLLPVAEERAHGTHRRFLPERGRATAPPNAKTAAVALSGNSIVTS
jgi:hypothetical protein